MKSHLRHMGGTVFLYGDYHSFCVGPSFMAWFTDEIDTRDVGIEAQTHEVRFDPGHVSVCSGYF
ncbi:MAG: hypothetical protein QW328_06970 [Nitrososphaerota archaeon]